MFFFEKKNQKTFIRLLGAVGKAPQKNRVKVFLLLFLQKKKMLPSPTLDRSPAQITIQRTPNTFGADRSVI